jgi:hypothetical protein
VARGVASEQSRQSKIDEPHRGGPRSTDIDREDVLWLEVPVEDAMGVERFEPAGDLCPHHRHLAPIADRDHAVQRHPRYVLHGVIGRAIVRAAEIEDAYDERVPEAAQELEFVPQGFGLGGDQPRFQAFERTLLLRRTIQR